MCKADVTQIGNRFSVKTLGGAVVFSSLRAKPIRLLGLIAQVEHCHSSTTNWAAKITSKLSLPVESKQIGAVCFGACAVCEGATHTLLQKDEQALVSRDIPTGYPHCVYILLVRSGQ